MSNKNYWENSEETIGMVTAELRKGFDLLNTIPNDPVTFFGSAKVKESDAYYQHCEQTAFALGKKGYTIITGGGPGIMRAANTGAHRAGAPSIGIRAQLIEGQGVLDYVYTDKIDFEFVFLRRFIMYSKSKAWIFYPGGI